MAKECSRCGKCCTTPHVPGTFTATGEDVKRWIREGRDDILECIDILGPPEDPYADLWYSPVTGEDVSRCPFVRKGRNLPTYRCTIYETRPQQCRDYTPFWPGNICKDV